MKKNKTSLYFEKLKKKFQLSIFNESTLESVFSVRVSRLDGILMAASILILLFFIFLLLLRNTGMSSFLPQSMDPHYREKVISDAYRVDSMAEVLKKQNKYVSVIQAIVSGNMPAGLVDGDGNKILLDTVSPDNLDKIKATKEEERFRQEYEEKEKDNLSTLDQIETKPDFLFYKPVKGKIKSIYNPSKKEYGMDFAIEGKQAVLSVLDGTVIFASYVAEYQYVIHVQHLNDFVSVYKFNSELIKKEGDKVKAGEVIAVISETSDTKNQNHLYFELWQKGFAMNPEDYILF